MLKFLKPLFTRTPPVPAVNDEVLGTLTWSAESEAWLVPAPVRCVTILIAGGSTPDPRLLSHAHDLAKDFHAFESRVQAFLHQEISQFQPFYTDEILSLQLESINLFWPKRPNDGMLWFRGGLSDRSWRCDYVARTPVGLGFDS